MSRIRLYGDTTGYIELKAPDVSNNVVVELPELPDQTSQSGKFLSTDGTDASWEPIETPVGKIIAMAIVFG